MKKLMLLTSAAAMMLASCSQDEVQQEAPAGRTIDFRAYTASRAAETTTANLETFYASAFDADGAAYGDFADVAFKANGGFFESVKKYYWPSDGAELTFFAYAPDKETLGGTLTVAKDAQDIKDFAPAKDVKDQVDFVYAHATGSQADEATGVALTFKHALAQIEIKAKNDNALTYKVAGYKIVGPATSGAFDFTTWTAGDEKNTYKVTYTEPLTLNGTAASLMGEAGNAMLVPQQLVAWETSDATNDAEGAYIALKVNVTDAEGALLFPKSDDANAYGWVAVPVATNWEAGKKYVYTLDFSTGAGVVAPAAPTTTDEGGDDDEENPGGDKEEEAPKPGEPSLGSPIKFTVTVTDWEEITDSPKMDL